MCRAPGQALGSVSSMPCSLASEGLRTFDWTKKDLVHSAHHIPNGIGLGRTKAAEESSTQTTTK